MPTRLLGNLHGVSYDDLCLAFGDVHDRDGDSYASWSVDTPADGQIHIYDYGRDGDMHGGKALTVQDVHVRLHRWRVNGGQVEVDRVIEWLTDQLKVDGATFTLDTFR
jgi:hypothetical protein